MSDRYGNPPGKVIEFIKKIIEVYKEYNMSLSHDDGQGAFWIEPLYAENVEWLEDASIHEKIYERFNK